MNFPFAFITYLVVLTACAAFTFTGFIFVVFAGVGT